MRKNVDAGENDGAEYGRKKSLHFETFDESAEHEEKSTVDDEGEDAECEQIDRQREDDENRLERDTNQPPEKSEHERGAETLHANTRYDMRQRQERERRNDPFEKYDHRCM